MGIEEKLKCGCILEILNFVFKAKLFIFLLRLRLCIASRKINRVSIQK